MSQYNILSADSFKYRLFYLFYRSVVVATVMYDSASFHDISQIQHKISSNSTSSGINEPQATASNHNAVGSTHREANAEVLSLNVISFVSCYYFKLFNENTIHISANPFFS